MTNVAGGFALAPHGGAGTLRRGEMTAERQAADRAGLWPLYQASTQGRLRCVRGEAFGTERSPAMIQRRVSAGSITSSISSTDAIEVALPFS
jgi:hypothetical protein